MVSWPVTAVFGASDGAPVHLNRVLASSSAVSHRTPCPARQPVRGPWPTSAVQRKPPAESTKPVSGLKAPPPVRETAPVGKLLTFLALKPWASLPPAASAGSASAS